MELYASKTRRATNTQAIRALVRTIRRGGIRCGILFQTGNNKVFRIRNTLLPSSKPTRSDGYKLFIGITLEIARSKGWSSFSSSYSNVTHDPFSYSMRSRFPLASYPKCHLSTTVRANAREPFDRTQRKENDDRLSFLPHRFNIHELSCE